MSLNTELAWDKARKVMDHLLCKQTGKHLSDIEILILQGAWEDQTYEEIAEAEGYSSSYLSKDVGNKLWHNLSTALQEKVSKKNFKAALQREWDKQTQAVSIQYQAQMTEVLTTEDLTFPEGSVALGSPFSIERSRCESVCYENIVKLGSLIRIKGAKWMGKTSLINRILEQAINCQNQIVYLNFDGVEQSILRDLNKLLRWFCAVVSRQLQLINKVNDYWDTDILGSNDNCTVYFEEYILAQITDDIVFAFDNVDKLFTYEEVIEDFFGMLRSWHEKGKTYHCWSRLKLVLAHSTEIYIPLDINQSPFNAGIPILLEEFDFKQVQKLATLYRLDWDNTQVTKLMNLLGGHPYLVRLGMYQIKAQNLTLEQLLQEATSETGIYRNPLRRLSNILECSPELNRAFQRVVESDVPVALDSRQIYQLHSRIEALIVDQVSLAGGTVADKLELPYVTVCNALLINREAGVPPYFTHWDYSSAWWAKLRNQLGNWLLNRLSAPISQAIQQQRQEWGLPLYPNREAAYSSIAQICQLPQEFDFPRKNLADCFHYTGPLQNPSGIESIAFPDLTFPWDRLTDKPLVYASLGTLQNKVPEVFQKIAQATADLDVQSVISLGNPHNDPADYNLNLPDDAIAVSFAPHQQLIERSSLVITHAGMNTTLGALSNGVPIVAIPITNEQPGIAARLARTGAGEVLRFQELTVKKLQTTIKKVLTEDLYKQNALRMQQAIKQAGGVKKAADLVEQAVNSH